MKKYNGYEAEKTDLKADDRGAFFKIQAKELRLKPVEMELLWTFQERGDAIRFVSSGK